MIERQGKLTVIRDRGNYLDVKCDCGELLTVDAVSFENGIHINCGSKRCHRITNYPMSAGDIFGDLKVVCVSQYGPRLKCKCGEEFWAKYEWFCGLDGITDCGCMSGEIVNIKKAYCRLINRIYNVEHEKYRKSSPAIKVYAFWLSSYELFERWVYLSGYTKGEIKISLNNKSTTYEPGGCYIEFDDKRGESNQSGFYLLSKSGKILLSRIKKSPSIDTSNINKGKYYML